jgi:hypothetical protein
VRSTVSSKNASCPLHVAVVARQPSSPQGALQFAFCRTNGACRSFCPAPASFRGHMGATNVAFMSRSGARSPASRLQQESSSRTAFRPGRMSATGIREAAWRPILSRGEYDCATV